MKLSVIIACYNAAGTLAAQLSALATQSWSEPWEVILVDNRSTDTSRTIAESFQGRLPNLRIVSAMERQGQPYASMVGALAARGESIAFCDADDEVGEGWVAAMGRALSQHEFVACRLDIEKLNPRWLQQAIPNVQCDGLPKAVYPPYLPNAGGGTLGVRRSLFIKFGGFDESLPYLHDTDFCFRLQLAGIKLHFVPNAVTHLRHRQHVRDCFRQARLWGRYSVLLCKRYQDAWGRTTSVRRWQTYLRRWEGIILRLPRLFSKTGRLEWVRSVGWQIGRLAGAILYHTAPW